jgi:hypothetical protein
VSRKVTLMVVALSLGTITACSSLPFSSPAPPPPAGPVVKVPPPKPEPPAKPETAAKRPPELRPEQLTGQTQDEAQALLGPPTTQSTQAMATVWTYRRGDCSLSLMFYPEVETAVQRVLGYEFGGGDAASCLKRLHEARNRNGK